MAETTRTSVSDPLLLIGGRTLLAALALIAAICRHAASRVEVSARTLWYWRR